MKVTMEEGEKNVDDSGGSGNLLESKTSHLHDLLQEKIREELFIGKPRRLFYRI